MKKLSIVILAIITMIMFTSPVMATEGFTPSKQAGCYEYQIKDDVMVINTAISLTLEKEKRTITAMDVDKMCNDAGKSLYGRLMKHPEVSRVVISDRQVAVVKYSFPRAWPDFQAGILEILDSVLCKK